MEIFGRQLDLAAIDKLTSQAGNPANISLKYNSGINGVKLWGKDSEIIPNLTEAFTHIFGEDAVSKLRLYSDEFNSLIDFSHEIKINKQNNEERRYNAAVSEAQLLAWTKLVVSQKPKKPGTEEDLAVFMPFPIESGDVIVALSGSLTPWQATGLRPNIAGLGLIQSVAGKLFQLPTEVIEECQDSLCSTLNCKRNNLYSEMVKVANSTRYSLTAVMIAAYTQYAAPLYPDYKFLVDSHVYEYMLSTKAVIPSNIISVDSNWNRFLEFKVEMKHIAWYLNQFMDKMPRMQSYQRELVNGVRVKEKFLNAESFLNEATGEQELHITFEGNHKLVVTNEGVFETDRNRQLYNAVVVTAQALDYTTDDIRKEDVIYMSSHGVLLQYLVQNAAVFAATDPFTGQFFIRRLLNELTFVAVEDTGEVDGDRRMLEKSTTITKVSEDYIATYFKVNKEGVKQPTQVEYTTLPFKLGNIIGGINKVVLQRHYRKQPTKYVQPWRVDNVAFNELNLARSKKHFIDGRRVALQAKYIPQEYRTTILKYICCKALGVTESVVEERILAEFPELAACHYSSDQLWEVLGNELVFGQSSKIAKLVKRAIMYAAQIGKLLEAEDVYVKQTGQKESSVNCQPVKSIVSAFHCYAQGVANTINGNGYLFNHIVPHRIDRKLSLRPVPADIKQPDSVTLDLETYLGKPTKSYQDDEKWTVYEFEPGVPKGTKEQILSMPYYPKGFKDKSTSNFNLFNEFDEGLITKVAVRYVATAGKIKQVQLRVTVTTLEHGVKGRGITKTMFAGMNPDVVINDLNPGLESGAVEAIFYKDTNKWLDTTFNLLPMIYQTAYKNVELWPEGVTLIEEINKVAGKNTWSALLDMLDLYTPLRKEFDRKFGKKAIWVQHKEVGCTKQQSCIALELEMYRNAAGWNQLNALPAEVDDAIPAEYTQIMAFIQGTPDQYEDNRINVKIFGTNEAKDNWYTAQRSRVYMGTVECPLYMPVKAEMASVRSLIGTSPAMGGTIRNVATQDREFAIKMLHKNFKAYNKYAGFLAMSRSSSIQPIQGEEFQTIELNVKDVNTGGFVMSKEGRQLLRTDKVKALYAATESEGTFLLELSKMFNNINFVIRTDKLVKENEDDDEEIGSIEKSSFSLYLPILVAQSAGAGFRTTDDLSSNVQILFSNLVNGLDWYQETNDGYIIDNQLTINLCNRIGGAIKSLAKTKGIAKCASFGVLGVMAKPTAIYGVPLNEVWVKKSTRYDSVYRTMLRTYKVKGSELDGYPALFSRAPMTATAKVRIRVVDEWHDAWDYINEDGFTFNPLACYFHGGDYDGDLNYLYPGIIDGRECNIPELTVDLLVAKITESTGSNQLKPGGSYYGDGFEVPTFKSVAKKRTFNANNLTLNSSVSNMLDPYTEVKPSLGQLLSGSTKMLLQAVGTAHRLFITTDLYATATEEFEELLEGGYPEVKSIKLNIAFIQILAEIYEVPLGGFDKWAYIVFYGHIIPLLDGSKESSLAVNIIESGMALPEGDVDATDLKTLSGIMNKAGMNGTIKVDRETGTVQAVADDVHKAIEAVQMCKGWPVSMKDIANKPFEQWGPKRVQMFLTLASEISFLLSKGLFLPTVEKSGAKDYTAEAPLTKWELMALGEYYGEEDYEGEENVIDEENDVSVQRQMLNAYVIGATALGIDQETAIASSTVFGPIEYYRKVVCAALLGDTVLLDTSYFTTLDKEDAEVIEVDVQPIVEQEAELSAEVEEAEVDMLSAFSEFVDSVQL